MPEKPFNQVNFTTSQVAHALQVSRTTIWNWIRSGKLRAHRIGPRGNYRIPRQSIVDLYDEPTAEACQAAL